MTLALAVDWTQILVYGVPAYIAALGAAVAAVIGSLNRRNLKTPSGDSIGTQVESMHHLTAANTGLLVKINGGSAKSAPAPPPAAPEATP